MSADAFLALKKAWKNTNLEEKQRNTNWWPVFFTHNKFLQPSNCSIRDRSHLATSMMSSSCFFTWWLSMMEASRETIHFLKRNIAFSPLRKENPQFYYLFYPNVFLFRFDFADDTTGIYCALTVPVLRDCLFACECWSQAACQAEVAGTCSLATPCSPAELQAAGAAPPSTPTAPRGSPGWSVRRSPPSLPAAFLNPHSPAKSLTHRRPSLEPAWSGLVSERHKWWMGWILVIC